MGSMPPGPDGKPLDPLAAAPVRRNMIMMVARQHSHALNTHPRLQEAAKEGNIDGRYFQESLKFRMKSSLLLEACMRVAIEKQAPELARTVVESVAMYKIGVTSPTSSASIGWFRGAVQAQYGPGNVPAARVHSVKIETEDEDEVATGDVVTVKVDVERTHAKAFTRQKVQLCQKQGLNPNEELRKYREGWWVILSAKKKGSGNPERLVLVRPILVSKIDMERTTIQMKFKGPPEAGVWEFRMDLKSQEFLGCDSRVDKEVTIVSADDVKKAEFLKNEEDEGEQKKGGKEDDDSSEDEEDGDVVLVNSPRNKGKGDSGDLRKRNVPKKATE
ncbi:hypothetical protein TrRE_jg7562 [Triparma retinervis]|uniref:SEC63 domain-containing protein n=1 Tax=Triparma retinervis TaxID=2557542 RepID=A0A9W7DZ21_9STRA|nr:hypothetical protein TrRE_jg7562 [Triparma retinervis]